MDKKGIELSINFVVMLVLALAVFSLGLVFVSKLFSKAEDIKLNLDKQSENELKSILSGGKQVAIWPQRYEIKKGHYKTLGISVLNRLKTAGAADTFYVKVSYMTAFDQANNNICAASPCKDNMNKGLLSATGSGTAVNGVEMWSDISKNTQHDFVVGVRIPDDAPSGIYIYQVLVGWDVDYDPGYSPERVYILVK